MQHRHALLDSNVAGARDLRSLGDNFSRFGAKARLSPTLQAGGEELAVFLPLGHYPFPSIGDQHALDLTKDRRTLTFDRPMVPLNSLLAKPCPEVAHDLDQLLRRLPDRLGPEHIGSFGQPALSQRPGDGLAGAPPANRRVRSMDFRNGGWPKTLRSSRTKLWRKPVPPRPKCWSGDWPPLRHAWPAAGGLPALNSDL
jgi:hypothetical protein